MSEHPKSQLNDMTREEIASYLTERGYPPYRAGQICQWIYRNHAASFDEMTNLPQDLRDHLDGHFTIARLREMRRITSRSDGTTKYLLKLPDGRAVESVYLPHPRGATLCVSSQVGCAFQCRICATGTMRLKRNLTPGEIVDQIRFLEEHIWDEQPGAGKQPAAEQKPGNVVTDKRKPTPGARAFSNVVLMGMGEPFANYDNVVKAVHLMIDELGIGSRRITVSTCGLPEKIVRFAGEPFEVGLALSLNSPFESKRKKLMPVAGKTPLAELMDAARNYHEKKGRMLTFEYVLVEGMNDRLRDAYALTDILRGIPAKLNLIAFNPFPGSRFRPPEASKIRRFLSVLESRGQKATLRKSKGSDILAGCGQLGAARPRKPAHGRRRDEKPAGQRRVAGKPTRAKQARSKRVHGKETRAKQARGKRAHGKETRARQAPGKRAHGKETRARQAPGKRAHGKETRERQAPGKRAHGKETRERQGHR